jgi:hypothetical protein
MFVGGGAQVVVTAPRAIRSPRLQTHLGISASGCGLLDPFGDFPSATSNARPTQVGATAAACRRHGLEVGDEGILKDLVVIFIFLGVLCTVHCYF